MGSFGGVELQWEDYGLLGRLLENKGDCHGLSERYRIERGLEHKDQSQ